MIRLRRLRPRIAAIRLAAAFGCASLASAPSAIAAPGDLDSAFGTGGVSLTALGSDDYVRDVALQPDGKIVAAGASWDGTLYRFALSRYNADGSLDPTFGDAGKVLTSVGTGAAIHAVALQPDGKIVAAGRAYNGGSPEFALARYTSAGSLDASFSGDGLVTTSIGSESTARDLVLEPDGRIDVAGHARVGGRDRVALARYTSAGALDTTFGSNGRSTAAVGDDDAFALALVRQDDGRLVAAGGASEGGVTKIALARFSSGGSLDSGFGSGGSVLTPVGAGALASSLLIDPDGRLVVAGSAAEGTTVTFAVARYGASGALDGSFGTGGVTLIQPGATSLGNSLARQPDGRLVVAGEVVTSGAQSFALSRLNADGSVDTGFGTGGSVTTAIGSRGEAHDVVVQPDGQIVVGGTGNVGTGPRQFALARYVWAAEAPDDGGGDAGGGDAGGGDAGGDTGGDTGSAGGDTGTGEDTGTGGDTGGDTGAGGDSGSGGGGDTGTETGGDPATGTDSGSGGSGSDPGTGGGLAGQIVPVDELGIIPPDVRPIVLPHQPLRLQGSGMVGIRLRCIELPTASCKGTVMITAPLAALFGREREKIGSARRRKAKMVRIARRSVTIPSGQTASLKLRLAGAARRALQRRGSLRVEVTASMSVDGQIRASRRTFTLRAPRKGTRKR
jgi:uncharacterized delta-60 repeat protein